MNGLHELLCSGLAYRLGWTLVHSLWQGAFVAGLFGLSLLVIPKSKANARYLFGCGSLLAVVAACAITFALVEPPARLVAHEAFAVDLAAAGGQGTLDPGLSLSADAVVTTSALAEDRPDSAVAESWREQVMRIGRATLTPVLPWVAAVWLAGVLALSLWRCGGLIATCRLRRMATAAVPDAVHELAINMAEKLRVSRPVQVLQSAVISTPAAIGHLRPVILLPVAALTGLAPSELEAIIAHELAHIRRYDYLVNIVQTVVDTLFFHHPAVWWMSGRVRAEREHCCDDLALAVSADRLTYARALAQVEELGAGDYGLAAAASGGSLLERIQRIVAFQSGNHEDLSRWLGGVATITTAAVALCLYMSASAPLQGKTQTPDPALQQGLARLEREKTPKALNELLAMNNGSMRGVDKIGHPTNAAGIRDVQRIRSAGREYVAVIARRYYVPFSKAVDRSSGWGVAFFFNPDGTQEGHLGGEPGEDGYNGDDVHVSTLGTPDQWFVQVVRFVKRPPFTYRSDVHLISPGLPRAFRVYNHPNSTAWTNEPKTREVPFKYFFWFNDEKNVIKWGDLGIAADGKPHDMLVGWDPQTNRFRGASQIAFKGQPVYRIDLGFSPLFEATDVPDTRPAAAIGPKADTEPTTRPAANMDTTEPAIAYVRNGKVRLRTGQKVVEAETVSLNVPRDGGGTMTLLFDVVRGHVRVRYDGNTLTGTRIEWDRNKNVVAYGGPVPWMEKLLETFASNAKPEGDKPLKPTDAADTQPARATFTSHPASEPAPDTLQVAVETKVVMVSAKTDEDLRAKYPTAEDLGNCTGGVFDVKQMTALFSELASRKASIVDQPRVVTFDGRPAYITMNPEGARYEPPIGARVEVDPSVSADRKQVALRFHFEKRDLSEKNWLGTRFQETAIADGEITLLDREWVVVRIPVERNQVRLRKSEDPLNLGRQMSEIIVESQRATSTGKYAYVMFRATVVYPSEDDGQQAFEGPSVNEHEVGGTGASISTNNKAGGSSDKPK